MSIIKCPNCGRETTDNLNNCIFCGCNVQEEKKSLEDFRISGNVLLKYLGNSSNVVIPLVVNTIGYGAFENCNFLRKIIISKNVNRIDENSFSNLENLEEIIFDDIQNLSIHYKAFNNVENVVKIIWNVNVCSCFGAEGLHYLWASPLSVSGANLSIVLGPNVSVIPRLLFKYTTDTIITIPYNVKEIEIQAFENENIKELNFENPSGWGAYLNDCLETTFRTDVFKNPKEAYELVCKKYVKRTYGDYKRWYDIFYTFKRK